jgi:hypothetical protein
MASQGDFFAEDSLERLERDVEVAGAITNQIVTNPALTAHERDELMQRLQELMDRSGNWGVDDDDEFAAFVRKFAPKGPKSGSGSADPKE